MTGDAGRLGEDLRALLAVLADSGVPLAQEELLDALWLARQMPTGADDAPVRRALARQPALAEAGAPADEDTAAVDTDGDYLLAPPTGPVRGRADPGPAAPWPTASPPASLPSDLPSLPPGDRAVAGLHAAPGHAADADRTADGPPGALALRVPEGKALRAELRIGRALRPLKQHRPSLSRHELDVEATVTALAETGLPDVALRPARERWLDLALVIDDGMSMLLWQRLAAEIRVMMERLGAFRLVRTYGLHSRGPATPSELSGRPFDPSSTALASRTLADPSGHTLVLVLSDGMGPAWRDGRKHEAVLRWARCGPTAILHALPRRMWDGSGIRAQRWQVTTRQSGAPNTEWTIADPVLPAGLAAFDGIPVPVIEPEPGSMTAWARLVAAPGGSALMSLLSRPEAARGDGAPRADGLGEVQRFRDAASPEAYRLAAHLAAVAPVSVPVMRLVQAAVPWQADTAHLAEVFLGGLLRPAEAGPHEEPLPPQHRAFDFTRTARDALLDAVPTAELMDTGRLIGHRLGQLAGRAPDFPAWLRHPDGPDGLPAGARAFAEVGPRLAARFGAPALPPPTPPRAPEPAAPPASPKPSPKPVPVPVPVPVPERAPETEAEVPWAQGATYVCSTCEEPVEPYDRYCGSCGHDLAHGRLTRSRSYPQSIGPYQIYGNIGMGPELDYDLYLGRAPYELSHVAVRTLRRGAPEGAMMGLRMEAEALRRMGGMFAPSLMDRGLHHDPPWTAQEIIRGSDGSLPVRLSALLDRTSNSAVPALDARTADLIGLRLAEAVSMCSSKDITLGSLTAHTVLVVDRTVKLVGWTTATIDGRYPPLAFAREANVLALGEILQALRGGRATAADALIAACLDPDPEARPAAEQVAKALARHMADPEGGTVSAPVPQAGSPSPLITAPAPEAPRPRSTRRSRLTSLFRRGERAAEAERQRESELIRTPLPAAHRIAVISRPVGAGRTTTTIALGSILASRREDKVIAVDVTPGGDAFERHVPRESAATIRDLALSSPHLDGYVTIRRFTSQAPSGLEVLAGSTSPQIDDEAYRRAIDVLGRGYSIILSDSDTSALDDTVHGVLDLADQLIVVTTPAVERIRSAGTTMARLAAQGHSDLVRRAITVLNQPHETPEPPRSRVEELMAYYQTLCRGVATVPYDPYLASGGAIDFSRLHPGTLDAYTRLAALVAEGFALSPPGR
ncbi:SAV_2336 N-terminal domain-related protein [Streptomyces sp. DSM 41524]|uniref:SAV_2336 N-terminal domain-related protein n=1 Tax=Streptomyces asiaticus subsp. ignotus TaxID=3098222 RepID=A0ABU7Q3C7_9ACTN|nr:SAV_2336 N-terminal domain-related protein [Streptomyces sp. DSM 41524]